MGIFYYKIQLLLKITVYVSCFLLQYVAVAQTAAATNTTLKGCENQIDCKECSPAGCTKCENLIVFATRQCVRSCPFGHSQQWSRLSDYKGQVCFNTGYIWGLSGEAFAILIGVTVGAILCIFIIIGGLIYLRYRKYRTSINNLRSELNDLPARRDFLKQLELFRPHSYTFLDMLNDTRRQIRELHLRGDHIGVAAYKPVVRDLAKLLVLLNRPPEYIIEVPYDWERISIWADKLLKRYKRMSDSSSSTQVAQLINFLQTPNNNSTNNDCSTSQSAADINSQFTTLSTFKPDQNIIINSSITLDDIAVQNFNNKYSCSRSNSSNNGGDIFEINPTWEFPNYSLVTMGTVNWNRSKEYLNNQRWFDDDFSQLGFRPQDEITTEL